MLPGDFEQPASYGMVGTISQLELKESSIVLVVSRQCENYLFQVAVSAITKESSIVMVVPRQCESM